jgi:hypothetical protein
MGKLVREVEDLAKVRPDLAAEWHPSKNRALTPRNVTRGSGIKAWWLCGEGHEWEAVISSRVAGNGCPYCSNQKVLAGFNDLATTDPEIANTWHPTKNEGLLPTQVTRKAHKKVWWICQTGHSSIATVADRTSGYGCGVCNGRQVEQGFNDLATTDPEIAAKWHPTKNGFSNPTQVPRNSNKKKWWLCPLGHSWIASVSDLTRGQGCAVCAGQQIEVGQNDLATSHPEIAAQWHPTKNLDLLPTQVTAFSHKAVWWFCTEGHDWKISVSRRAIGRGCSFCAGKKVWKGFNDLATTDPVIAATWHPTKNEGLLPTQVTRKSHKKVWWICPLGHAWSSVISSRTNGNNCPYCSGTSVLQGFNDLATTDPELANEWHPKKNIGLSLVDVSRGSSRKVWWVCAEGHEWNATVSHRANDRGCPRCATSGYDATSDGYLYLLRKDHLGLQQFGITNKPDDRLTKHQRNGWDPLDIVGPADGYWIRETETALRRFFRSQGVLLPRDYPDKFDGFSESWQSDELVFSTIAEMLEALREWEG